MKKFLIKIKTYFKLFWNKHIVNVCPKSLDDIF